MDVSIIAFSTLTGITGLLLGALGSTYKFGMQIKDNLSKHEKWDLMTFATKTEVADIKEDIISEIRAVELRLTNEVRKEKG